MYSNYLPYPGVRSERNAGPPPHKRAKSSVVITRYPPPPGYSQNPKQVSAQPQPYQWPAPYLANGYGIHGWEGYPQHQYQSPHSPAYVAHTGVNNQVVYGAPTAARYGNPAPPYLATPNSASVLSPGHSAPNVPQTYCTPVATPLPPYSTWPTQTVVSDAASPLAPSRAYSWSAQDCENRSYSRRQSSASANPASTNDAPNRELAAEARSKPHCDNLEDDYTSESYFAQNPEEIELSLSLGLIEWKPARHTKRAMASTFKEAELEDIAPSLSLPVDDDCVSRYFTRAKRADWLLDVRDTPYWNEVENDLVFRKFHDCPTIISLDKLRARFRDRRDGSFLPVEDDDSTPSTPDPLNAHDEPAESVIDDVAMDLGDSISSTSPSDTGKNDPLGLLEKELFPIDARTTDNPVNKKRKCSHSIAGEGENGNANEMIKAVSTVQLDQKQEDILMALGVNGSPKPPCNNVEWHGLSWSGAEQFILPEIASGCDTNGLGSRPPPPPPPPPAPCSGSSMQHHSSELKSSSPKRPGSRTSNCTATGSDFDMESSPASVDETCSYLGNKRSRYSQTLSHPGNGRGNSTRDLRNRGSNRGTKRTDKNLHSGIRRSSHLVHKAPKVADAYQ